MDSVTAGETEIVDFWSQELLARLDWKRLEDVTLKMVAKGGFHTRLLERDPDGGALYSVAEGKLIRRQDAFLRMAPWRSGEIGVDAVRKFYTRLLAEKLERGVYISTGNFSAEARSFAKGRSLELVDSRRYLETMRRLNLRERDQLLNYATEGDFTAPSCPRCSSKMKLRESEAPEYEGKGESLRFRELIRVKRQVRCNELVIEEAGRVVFDRGAYCERMVVRGQVTGHFACSGTVEIYPTGRIIGTVAAQSIQMHPGGAVEGEMKIKRKGTVDLVGVDFSKAVWGCTNYPKCKMVIDV
jgi:ssDNA-binding Zn-finger/Zn-ribbon topoisomerase 1